MLISHVRVMFDSQGQWSKKAEEQMLTIENILKYFAHIVSKNQALYYTILKIGCSGF